MKRIFLFCLAYITSVSYTNAGQDADLTQHPHFSSTRIGVYVSNIDPEDADILGGGLKIDVPVLISGARYDVEASFTGANSFYSAAAYLKSPLGMPLGGRWVANILPVYPSIGIGGKLLYSDGRFDSMAVLKAGLTYALSKDVSISGVYDVNGASNGDLFFVAGVSINASFPDLKWFR